MAKREVLDPSRSGECIGRPDEVGEPNFRVPILGSTVARSDSETLAQDGHDAQIAQIETQGPQPIATLESTE